MWVRVERRVRSVTQKTVRDTVRACPLLYLGKFFHLHLSITASSDEFDAISDDFITALEALSYGKAKSNTSNNGNGDDREHLDGFDLTGDVKNVGRVCRGLMLRFIDSIPVQLGIINPRSIDVTSAGRLVSGIMFL